MVLTSENFTTILFVHCCCLLAWTAGSPALRANLPNSHSFLQRTLGGRSRGSVQNVVIPEPNGASKLFSDENPGENDDTSYDSLALRHEVKRQTAKNIRVPQYMMDIYTHLQDKKWVPRFDIARSFKGVRNVYSQHTDAEGTNNHLYGNIKACYILDFNIRIPKTEKTEFAQLRLYAKHNEDNSYFGYGSRISVFWVPNDTTERLLESRNIQKQKHSRITFNVTGVVHFWARDSGSQQRLKIQIQDLDHPYSSSSVHSELSQPLEVVQEPQILVFSSKVHASNETGHSQMRKKRSLELDNFPDEMNGSTFTDYWEQDWNELIGHVVRKRSEDDDEETEEMTNNIVEELGRMRKGKLRRKKNPCRRRPLLVNFASINYDQWIIAPPSYEAFECSGKCTFPMSAHLTPTKHAVIQTLIHGLEPKGVARACCVPTKLNPISVIYVDDNGVVTYHHKYEDMVVAECGCR